MAGSLNRVTLIGNLGDHAEVSKTQSGKLLMKLSVATTETWKGDNGKQERTEWHRVICFNENLINALEDYLRKGQKIFVEGQLRTRSWEDEKTGQKRYMTEIVMSGYDSKILLLGGKDRRNSDEDDDDYTERKEKQEKREAARERGRPARSAAKRRDEPKELTDEEADFLDDTVPF